MKERNKGVELPGTEVGRFHGVNIILPTADNCPERKGTGYATNQLEVVLKVEEMRQSLAAKLGDPKEAAELAVELYHRSLMGDGTMIQRL